MVIFITYSSKQLKHIDSMKQTEMMMPLSYVTASNHELYWSLTPFNPNIHCQLPITSSTAIKKNLFECPTLSPKNLRWNVWVLVRYKRLLVPHDVWFTCIGSVFFIRPLEEIDKIVRKQMITVHVFVGLTSVMPPFFCQHFLWCSYLPFINPTSGYVCNDNGLHTNAAHLSVTGYNVSYWPSHPMAHPSSVFLALAHTFSIIN